MIEGMIAPYPQRIAASLFTLTIMLVSFAGAGASRQEPGTQKSSSQPTTRTSNATRPAAVDFSPMIARGIEHLLAVQEGDGKVEWPYEGVYRVGGQIPIGYRVGGTALCATALIRAPNYEHDAPRQQANARATRFIIDSRTHTLMNPIYDGGYDVRGWGYTCALAFLLELESRGAVPPEE